MIISGHLLFPTIERQTPMQIGRIKSISEVSGASLDSTVRPTLIEVVKP